MSNLLAAGELAARARRALSVPLVDTLGTALIDPADPPAGAWFVVGELAENGVGGLHAAALGAVLEVGGYLALLPLLSTVEHAVSNSVATQLIAAAVVGDRVEVRGMVDRRSKRLGFVSVHATVDGKTIARAQLTKSIVKLGRV